MDDREIRELIASLTRDLRGADLSEAKLVGKDLSRINFYGVRFNKANLSSSDLSNCHLQEAHLVETNLRKASLSGSALQSANVSKANLEYADLEDADFRNANLSDANVLLANFDATFIDDANLSGVKNLTVYQIENSKINRNTVLPDYISIEWKNVPCPDDSISEDYYCRNLEYDSLPGDWRWWAPKYDSGEIAFHMAVKLSKGLEVPRSPSDYEELMVDRLKAICDRLHPELVEQRIYDYTGNSHRGAGGNTSQAQMVDNLRGHSYGMYDDFSEYFQLLFSRFNLHSSEDFQPLTSNEKKLISETIGDEICSDTAEGLLWEILEMMYLP